MSHWKTIAYWIGINVILGVFGPLLVSKMYIEFLTPKPHLGLRQFYEKGELGLVSLVTGLSVMVDMLKSHYSSQVTIPFFGLLIFFCSRGAQVWGVSLAYTVTKTRNVDWQKVWTASWHVALAVFSVGLVAEILVELASG